MDRGRVGNFVVGNKLCADRVLREKQDAHQTRLRHARSLIDFGSPSSATLRPAVNLKGERQRDERYNAIHNENQRMLGKMSEVMGQPIPTPVGSVVSSASRSLNRDARKQQIDKITQENQRLYNAIHGVRSEYSKGKHDASFKTSEKYLRIKSEYDVVIRQPRSVQPCNVPPPHDRSQMDSSTSGSLDESVSLAASACKLPTGLVFKDRFRRVVVVPANFDATATPDPASGAVGSTAYAGDNSVASGSRTDSASGSGKVSGTVSGIASATASATGDHTNVDALATGSSDITLTYNAAGDINDIGAGDITSPSAPLRFFECQLLFVTDGKTLAITAREGRYQTTMELFVPEAQHRRLYVESGGDYEKIAAKLRVAGKRLVLDASYRP